MARNQSLQLELQGQETLELEGLHQSPILCGPYDEPGEHWAWDENKQLGKKSFRRPAGYYYKTEKTSGGQQQLFQDENWDELTLVNRMRDDVRRWRDNGYQNPSPTNITRRLLEHWFNPNRERRLFFCQREAVETLIYLAELRLGGKSGTRGLSVSQDDLELLLSGVKPSFHVSETAYQFPTLVDVPFDRITYPLELRRAACKMATGSGKTVVMAMLVAWSLCNAAHAPYSEIFPSVALICAPNLTVKERLQVLRPDVAGNYYEEFNIVPPDMMPMLKRGRVIIENWHTFAPRSGNEEGGVTSKVVQKGEEGPEDIARRVLGDAFGRWPFLVLNDEGHHAWRPAPPLPGEEKADKDEQYEATLWVNGLDAFNNARDERDVKGNLKRGVALCVDLSATPFFIAGSGHPEGAPFPWVVSDFGLTDAIESGIVKIPRVPVVDATGRSDPKYFRLWKHIHNGRIPADYAPGRKRLKPEVIYRESEDALKQLAGGWKRTFDNMMAQNPVDGVPPVLIVVCDNTDVAQIFFERISGEIEEEENGKKMVRYSGSAILEDFANREHAKRTIRIDSKLLAQAESDDPKVKKSDAAELLRQVVATVGRKGQPGEQVRCVVSVAMLTEGWDANTVTHILGVRAFHSQLLCEQVVGRGLRRISYEINPETGKFTEETADVYGIPFSIVPFRAQPTGKPTGPEAPMQRVYAMPERRGFEMRFPNVEGYAFALRHNRIRFDLKKQQAFPLNPNQTPTATFVAPIVAAVEGQITAAGTPFEHQQQDRQAIYENLHLQTVKFQMTQEIISRLLLHKEGMKHQSRHELFSQVFALVDAYVGDPENQREGKVRFNGCHPCDVGLDVYFTPIVERIADAIEPDIEAGEAPLLPILNRFQPFGTTATINFITRRPLFQQVKRTHLNAVVCDTDTWEQSAVFALESSDHVLCYARNDRLGLRIPYEYQGVAHFYEPDFLVRLADGSLLLLEIKGWSDAHDAAKHDAADKWIRAVNNWARLRGEDKIGPFRPLMVCKEPQLLKQRLAQL